MPRPVYAPQSALESVWAATRAAVAVRASVPNLAVPWHSQARPEQLPPPGNWRIWYMQGGRGSGKTRGGSEWLADEIEKPEPAEWAIVAPTFGDARDKCVEGPKSGLLRALNRRGISYTWNRSYGQLTTDNGHRVHIDGGDDGALRIQGFNLSGVWADEVGLWKKWRTAWDESITFAVRMAPARIVATGTPKVGHKLVKQLIDESNIPGSGTIRTLLRTSDNIDNLDEQLIEALKRRYAGTSLERQELEGEFITELPNSLWTREQVESKRVWDLPDLSRVVVSIDPAVSVSEDSDETGIIVTGAGQCTICNIQERSRLETHAFVLADHSGKYKPHHWAGLARRAMVDWEADRIIGEINNGGDMIEHTLRATAKNIPFKAIRASRGKRVRAEPVHALYEQGKVHHFGILADLEEQMFSFTGEDTDSDDRIDAMVYGITELMGKSSQGMLIGWANG